MASLDYGVQLRSTCGIGDSGPLHRHGPVGGIPFDVQLGELALLSAGADLNVRAGGLTPMQIAQHSAAVDVVRVLKAAIARTAQ